MRKACVRKTKTGTTRKRGRGRNGGQWCDEGEEEENQAEMLRLTLEDISFKTKAKIFLIRKKQLL